MAHLPLFKIVLQQVAAVVHGLGGLDLEADLVGQLVDLAKDLFEVLAREQVVQLAAAHGDEEEDIPHDDGKLLKEIAEVIEIVRVVAADGGVYLDGDASFIGPLHCLDRASPCAGQAAECVVDLGSGAIERNAEADDARLFQLEDGVAVEQGGGAGRQRDLNAFIRRVMISSKTSLRFSGSPPVKTKMGICISAIWSISALPSAFDSSSGCAMG